MAVRGASPSPATPKARNLTSKQMTFAQLVAAGETKSDAYRKAYNVKTVKASNIAVRGCMLAKNPQIAEMISKLKDPIAHKVGLTLESHLYTLQEIALEARAAGHYSAAVAAEVARAKAAGIHVERHENRNLNVNTQLSTNEMKEIASRLLSSV
jgi:hypothetical protein